MKIVITKQTSVGGKPARVGDRMDVSEKDARILFAVGKAVPAAAVQAEPEAKPVRGGRGRVQTREPEVQARDPLVKSNENERG